MAKLYMITKTYPVNVVHGCPAWLTDVYAIYQSKAKADYCWSKNDLGNREGYRYMEVDTDLVADPVSIPIPQPVQQQPKQPVSEVAKSANDIASAIGNGQYELEVIE